MPRSRYGQTHGDDYYNDYLEDEPLELFTKFAIHPPDDADGFKGTDLLPLIDVRTDLQGNTSNIRVAKMGGRKVAFINLSKKNRGTTPVTGNEGAGVLDVKAKYTPDPTWVPVYWLPWDASGAIIRLQIPQEGSRSPGKEDPDLFFTAAINGCSVFVKGPAEAPEVYHCGGSTYISDPDRSAEFWRGLVERVSGGRIRGEANKTHYIAERGLTSKDMEGKKMPTTSAALQYRDWIKSNYSALEVREVNPWGCVMGIRENGTWKFYLQQNATIRYTTLRKVKTFGISRKKREKEPELDFTGQQRHDSDGNPITIEKTRAVGRPMSVQQIYPTATASTFIPRSLPAVIHG